jgi:membrane protein insertase Oxa1/YidC/SpoIIIJ
MRQIAVRQRADTCCGSGLIRVAALGCQRLISTTPNPDKPFTYFSALDQATSSVGDFLSPTRAWNRLGQVFDFLSTTVDQTVISDVSGLGVSWAIFAWGLGFLLRLSTLYFSLSGERATVRLRCAAPELRDAMQEFQLVYCNRKASALDINLAAAQFRSLRQQIYAKYDTSNRRALLSPFKSSPFILGGFALLNRAIAGCDSLRGADGALAIGDVSLGKLWLGTLTQPDPVGVLPVVCAALTLVNLELAFRNKLNNPTRDTSSLTLMWLFRGGAVSLIPIASQLPAVVLLYWLGLSTAGLAQPLLMRSQAFRKAFKVPTPESDPLELGSGQTSSGIKGTLERMFSVDRFDRRTSPTPTDPRKQVVGESFLWQRVKWAMPKLSQLIDSSTQDSLRRKKEEDAQREKIVSQRPNQRWKLNDEPKSRR